MFGGIIGLVFGISSGGRFGPNPSSDPYSPVKDIVASQFDAETASGTVLVDFYAPWCGPCRIIGPRVEALAGEFTGRAKFVKVNVDHAPELAQRFGIEGIPTLMFFKDGKRQDTIVGVASVAVLRSRLEKLTNAADQQGKAMANVPAGS